MIEKRRFVLLTNGTECSDAFELGMNVIRRAWDNGSSVRVRRIGETGSHEIPPVTLVDLEWADVTVIVGA